MQRFRGGLVFKAHRLLYHSTLGLRVKKKKKDGHGRGEWGALAWGVAIPEAFVFQEERPRSRSARESSLLTTYSSSSSLLLSSLQMSDSRVYEPKVRALPGTASHFYEVVVLELRTHNRRWG